MYTGVVYKIYVDINMSNKDRQVQKWSGKFIYHSFITRNHRDLLNVNWYVSLCVWVICSISCTDLNIVEWSLILVLLATQFNLTLTHWGRVTYICVRKMINIVSDNGLSPSLRQAEIWTNAGILLIGHLRINFSEIFIEIETFSFRKKKAF